MDFPYPKLVGYQSLAFGSPLAVCERNGGAFGPLAEHRVGE